MTYNNVSLIDFTEHFTISNLLFSLGIEQDAYAIYSKYISCDAPFPIGVNEEIRIIIESMIYIIVLKYYSYEFG